MNNIGRIAVDGTDYLVAVLSNGTGSRYEWHRSGRGGVHQ